MQYAQCLQDVFIEERLIGPDGHQTVYVALRHDQVTLVAAPHQMVDAAFKLLRMYRHILSNKQQQELLAFSNSILSAEQEDMPLAAD